MQSKRKDNDTNNMVIFGENYHSFFFGTASETRFFGLYLLFFIGGKTTANLWNLKRATEM